MENKTLESIKALIIPGKHAFVVGKIPDEIFVEEPIREIRPYYSNDGTPVLYNLVGGNEKLLASIQANDAIILY